MSLYNALQKRGYAIRQHLEEVGWTRRKLTCIDLDETQRNALEQGGTKALAKTLTDQNTWSFPALDIKSPLPARRDLTLVQGSRPVAAIVVPESIPHLSRMARQLNDAIHRKCNLRLPLHNDTEATRDLLQSGAIILFGGPHENRLAMDTALRYQTGFIDATIPGEDGWVVTTHTGLNAAGHNICEIAAWPSRIQDAMAFVIENLDAEDDQIVLRHTHRIEQGPAMQAHFPSWDAFIAGLPGRIPRFQGQSIQAPQDLDALADLLGQGLDSGGPDVNFYNAAPIDIAISCAQYYQRSGDSRALQLFYKLLFRLADYYLKTPEGASYPADLDFRLGNLILYYARFEHDPIFTEDDRLILSNLLLSCTRSIYEYMLACWPIEPNAPTRHNHETFPARSLLFAADYFERYNIPDAATWRDHADATFTSGLWRRFKQRENANHYEQAVFEHGASYSAFTGKGFDLFDPQCLRLAALRHVITTDNFLRPVDYGDASVSLTPRGADRLAILAVARQNDPTLQWFAQACFDRHPNYTAAPLECIRRPYRGDPPQTHAWESLPLDPEFHAHFCPEFPIDYAFDKLAYRTGWTDNAHYLLFEGIGNQQISHSHNELNAIVRLNHLGRHWIVSNGYGRRAGLTNVNQSFNTRVRGPEDHNMLVLTRDKDILRDLPMCNALLQQGQKDNLAYLTGGLLNYAGIDWFRTLFILADQCVLVIDRIHAVNPAFDTAHIEWNGLGQATRRTTGFRLDQQGVFMDIHSPSDWTARQDIADQSADWKSTLEGGRYPYASFPLTKLIFQMPDVQAGKTYCLITLLAATHESGAPFQIREPEPGRVCLEGPHGQPTNLCVSDQDLILGADANVLEIRFAAYPKLPDALKPHSAAP